MPVISRFTRIVRVLTILALAVPLGISAVPEASGSADGVAPQAVRLASSAAPSAGLLDDCLRSDAPTVADYASGAECPPIGFPYEPTLKITKAGLRALDPYTDGCSFPAVDTGAFWNFKDACAIHDYMADLQRFGAKGVTESGMDNQFLLDMKADCKGRNIFARSNCNSLAVSYRAGVQEGNYATGDPITIGN